MATKAKDSILFCSIPKLHPQPFYFEMGSHLVVKVSLKLGILLPQPPKNSIFNCHQREEVGGPGMEGEKADAVAQCPQ